MNKLLFFLVISNCLTGWFSHTNLLGNFHHWLLLHIIIIMGKQSACYTTFHHKYAISYLLFLAPPASLIFLWFFNALWNVISNFYRVLNLFGCTLWIGLQKKNHVQCCIVRGFVLHHVHFWKTIGMLKKKKICEWFWGSLAPLSVLRVAGCYSSCV